MKTPITFYWTTSNDMKSEQNSARASPFPAPSPQTTYDVCVCVCVRGVWQPFGSLSNELKLCIDAFWANNLHRNGT